MLRWLTAELRSLAWLTLYFAACYAIIMLLKQLWLEEYGIAFRGIATALVAAVITAKVVIVLDHIPMTRRLQALPGIIEVVTRSAIYTGFVLAIMTAEKVFESRAEHGGLINALEDILVHPDMPEVVGTAVMVALAFLSHHTFHIIHRNIGNKRMTELFLSRKAKTGQPMDVR